MFSLNGVMYENRDEAIQAAIAYCKKTNNTCLVFHKQGYWQPIGDMLGMATKNGDSTVKFVYSLKENILIKLGGLFHIGNESQVCGYLLNYPQTVDELVWCYHEINNYITPNNGCNLEIHTDPETGEKELWIMVQISLERYKNGAGEQLSKFDSEYYLDKLADSLVNVNLEFS